MLNYTTRPLNFNQLDDPELLILFNEEFDQDFCNLNLSLIESLCRRTGNPSSEAEVSAMFEELSLDGKDEGAVRLEFSLYLDSLVRDGAIHVEQAEQYTYVANPYDPREKSKTLIEIPLHHEPATVKRSVVIRHFPNELSPYVVHYKRLERGGYFEGGYYQTLEKALEDLQRRVLRRFEYNQMRCDGFDTLKSSVLSLYTEITDNW